MPKEFRQEGRKNDMKKAAIVWSSPNADGLTASAKNQFMKGLTDA